MSSKIKLTENDIKGFQTPMEAEMEKSMRHYEGELVKLRTGRAHTSLIEGVEVVAYGQAQPLKNMAMISAPESRLLTVQPWDLSIIADIEKALLSSHLGLTPINDGKIIRIQLPEMSRDRREELLKVLGKKQEECKVSIRNVRKDFNNLLRDSKKDKEISENFFNRLSDILEKVTTKYVAKADELAEKKKKDITTV